MRQYMMVTTLAVHRVDGADRPGPLEDITEETDLLGGDFKVRRCTFKPVFASTAYEYTS